MGFFIFCIFTYMDPLMKFIFKHYDITYIVMKDVYRIKTVYSIKIYFTPKKYFYLTPDEIFSKVVYHVFPDGKIDLYDMWYIRENDMPILDFFHSDYELDEWLENESKRILDEELNNKS